MRVGAAWIFQKSELEKICKAKNIKLNIHRWREEYFSNLVNRDIVEEEFLKKGLQLQKIKIIKGLYPLGYNLTPSFGFESSFCATDLNISNTCPIVLWWGNVIEKGNEVGLLVSSVAERISDKDVNPFDADWEPEKPKMMDTMTF